MVKETKKELPKVCATCTYYGVIIVSPDRKNAIGACNNNNEEAVEAPFAACVTPAFSCSHWEERIVPQIVPATKQKIYRG